MPDPETGSTARFWFVVGGCWQPFDESPGHLQLAGAYVRATRDRRELDANALRMEMQAGGGVAL